MTLFEYCSLFHPISEKVFQQMLLVCKPLHIKKGTIITHEGQVQRHLLFVEGGIQMSFFDHGEKQQVIAFTYAPGISGIPDSFLRQTPSRYSLIALTDSRFLTLSYSDLQLLFDQTPEIERLFRKMAETMLVGMIERHLELQTLSIEARFRTFTQRSAQLLQMVPHKYLASYLHMNPTNFSKLFNSIKI